MIFSTKSLKFAALVALATAFAAPAFAADLPTMKAPPAPAVEPIQPLGFFVRLGVVYAINTSSSSVIVPAGPGVPPTITVPGGNAKVGNVGTIGAEVGYFVTQNISIDVAAGLPQWSHVTIQNPNGFGLAAGVPPTGTILGKIMPSFIPVTANYHFMGFGAFQPYLGAGFAPVFSFATRDGYDKGVSVASTVGLVLVAGADVMVNSHWGVNVNVKKLFASSTTTATGIAIAPGVPINTKLNTYFQPWILATGVTYRF